jgi:hypothetical protein
MHATLDPGEIETGRSDKGKRKQGAEWVEATRHRHA